MTPNEAVKKLLSAAQADVDNRTREIPRGSNDSPRIAVMLSNVGLYDPDYWCMAAVYTWFLEAGLAKYAFRSGLCQDIYNWAKRKGILTNKPSVGDIGLVRSKSGSNSVHHTFLVTKVNADGSVGTIEGNTNDEGARDGYEVCERTRGESSRLVFVHWQKLLPITAPDKIYTLQVGQKAMTRIDVLPSGTTILSLRSFLLLLFSIEVVNENLEWDKEASTALWKDDNLPTELEPRLLKGETYVLTRPALDWMGLEIKEITAKNVIVVQRKKA